MIKVTSYGAAQTVTGSCHLIKMGSLRILIDCGMFQGEGGHKKIMMILDLTLQKLIISS